jgi:Polysaccharide lyase family 4, domain II
MKTTTVTATALAAALFIVPISTIYAGSITGQIRFSDELPKLAVVKVSKDQDYCGEFLPNETYIIDSNGGLKNVVVFIESASSSGSPEPKLNVLENNGCRYSPRIMAMQKGERLRVRNNDPKLHIPHSYLNERTVFNLSLPFRGTSIDASQKIRQSGILKVVCDTHAWMLAHIHVFDHPYFAVTDDRGMFSIANIPAGTYTLTAWHEDAGIRSQEITVSETGDVGVNFEFSKR